MTRVGLQRERKKKYIYIQGYIYTRFKHQVNKRVAQLAVASVRLRNEVFVKSGLFLIIKFLCGLSRHRYFAIVSWGVHDQFFHEVRS